MTTTPTPSPQAASLLSWRRKPRLPVILQTEATECGLACLGMVAGYYGLQTDLSTLRRSFQVSLMGSTMAHLVAYSKAMGLSSRAVKVELTELGQLRLPCVLHWEFNHFVVLREVRKDRLVVHDPAVGEREIRLADASDSFTGVALELWPAEGFRPAKLVSRISLLQLFGRMSGIRGAIVQLISLALVLELFVLISPFFLQWVIDDVVVSADQDLLVTLAIAFGLLVVVQQAVGLLRGWVGLVLSNSLSLQWRSNLFAHLTRLPVSFFEARHLGDIVSRFGSVDVIQRSLTTEAVEALLDGIMSITVLIMMLVYAPSLAAVAISAVVLYSIIRWIWWQPLRQATEEQIVHAARQSSHFLETVRGIKPLKRFQRLDLRRQSWMAHLADEINTGLRTQRMQLAFRQSSGLIFGLERVLVIALGAGLVIDGNFTVGALMAFLAYKDQFTRRAAVLVERIFEFRMLRLHAERLADIALAEPEEERTLPAVGTPTSPRPSRNETQPHPSIRIEGLVHRYGSGLPAVLDGLSLTIRQGESVALVGRSGSGKSTLVSLLTGLREPTGGQVWINGRPLFPTGQPDGLSLEELRGLVGTVTQDDLLFAGSLADNISFFDPEANLERIQQAAALADIAQDIEAMPMGYNTLVGDMGTVLSGGQRQRVLLARALYSQPQILILDEATSSLDLESEERVSAAIASLSLTRLIVAHRPQTFQSADRALVLREGRIAAELPAGDLAGIRAAMTGQ